MQRQARQRLTERVWVALLVASCGGRTTSGELVGSSGAGGSAGSESVGGAGAVGGIAGSGGQKTGGAGVGGAAVGGASVGGVGAGGMPGGSSTGAVGGVAGHSGAGTGGVGGLAGSGGGPGLDPTLLVGNYDISFGVFPSVDGCEPEFAERHLNLQVDRFDDLVVTPFPDFRFHSARSTQPTLEPGRLLIEETRYAPSVSPVSPRLELGVDEYGLTGAGYAEITYRCDDPDQGAVARVHVTVTWDRISPSLRLTPSVTTHDGHVFGFTTFRPEFSEPVTLPSGSYQARFDDIEEAQQFVELIDDLSAEPFDVTWSFAIGGPVVEARLSDPDVHLARRVRTNLLGELFDRAGNRLVDADEAHQIVDTSEVAPPLEFDDGPSVGAYGNVTYVAPGAANSPCEAGGCLVLEGPGYGCAENPEAPAALLAVRLHQPPARFTIRYRLLSNGPGQPGMVYLYPSGCLGSPSSGPKRELMSPVDGFSWGSDWSTAILSTCAGPDRDPGVVIALGCDSFATAASANRLIIERIEPAE